MSCSLFYEMPQSVIEGLMEGVGEDEFRRLVLALYDVLMGTYEGLYDLIKGFDEDLSRGVSVNVDEYYREVVGIIRNMHVDTYYIIIKLNEALSQHPELLKVLPRTAPTQSLDAVNKMFGAMAGVLFRLACGLEEPRRGALILLAESYLDLAVDKPLDAIVLTLASIALARGRRDVAAELLRRVGVDLEGIINFACGAVELAKFLEEHGIHSIPE